MARRKITTPIVIPKVFAMRSVEEEFLVGI